MSSQALSNLTNPRGRLWVADPTLELTVRQVAAGKYLTAQRVQSLHTMIPGQVTSDQGRSPRGKILVQQQPSQNAIVSTTVRVRRRQVSPGLGEAKENLVREYL